MPGVYKEKSCKFCKKLYRKIAVEYNKTPEAIAKQKQLNTPLASMTADEFAVPIPTIQTLDDFLEFTEGYDKAEKW
jgi:hypothetical protein